MALEILPPDASPSRDATDGDEPSPTPAIDPKRRARVESDPLVRRAMDLFNARITDIRDADS